MPGDGLGYGLLRHLLPATVPALAAAPAPLIGFNYLGRRRRRWRRLWTAAPDAPALPARDPAMPLAHALDLGAVAVDTPDGPCCAPPGGTRGRCWTRPG